MSESDKEKELDRIIDEGEEVMDLDFYKWIICKLASNQTLQYLKSCRKELWTHDVRFWNDMNKGGYKDGYDGIYVAGQL